MLRMICLNTAQCPPLSEDIPVVHPFYCDTFSTLYHIPKEALSIDQRPYPTENYHFLLDTLRPVLQEGKCPSYFFDIRSTEEFTQTAPEYALLDGLHINNAQPLCVKGMGSLALPQGFRIASLYLKPGEQALMCCSRLETKYDSSGGAPRRMACGFLLERGAGDLTIERFGLLDSCSEVQKLVDSSNADSIYTEEPALTAELDSSVIVCGEEGMLEPFSLLMKTAEPNHSLRLLVILKQGRHYGFYQILRKERSSC